MRGREQQNHTSAHLIRAAPFLHKVLGPTNSGLQRELELELSMPPWIINFKVGTVIQTPNESVLPQSVGVWGACTCSQSQLGDEAVGETQ